MSLLDTASLIVTPNGYKEGKLYSVIPSDGSGDMSVTRATTATRVNSAGLVELVPYNLLTYSNTFSNAAWNKINSTVTSGQSGYDGSTNAWKLQATATNNCEVDQAFSESETKTFSIYAKAGNVNFVAISVFGAGFGWYNLSNGTLGSSGGTFVSRDIESVGNGWYRCSIVTSVAASGVAVYVCNADNSIATSVGSNIFIQNSQLEGGSVPTTYQKTETRLNIPRLDYSNGTCPSLLVEPQRTNFALWSEDIAQALPTYGGGSITANNTTAPNGIQTADKFTVDTSTGTHYFYNSYAVTNGQSYTTSIFLKKGTGRYFLYRILTNLNAFRYGVTIDLETGTILSSNTMGTPTGTASKIEDYGNGWYRVSLTINGVGTLLATLLETSNTGTPTLDSFLDYSYAGNGTDTYYLWGMQIEAGSYPTSYIPTTSASVTRNADVISKTGISSLIGQTEGAVMIDINIDSSFAQNDMRFIDVSDDSIANWYFIGTNAANEIRFYFRSSNTAYVSITTTLTNGRHKLAFAYKNNDYVAYVDGVQVHSTTTLAVGSTSKVTLGNDFGGFNPSKQFINASALWKTRLTNAQLATLTTI